MDATEHSRTTLLAVAQAAGVSVPTVSKVVNGRSDVAAHTRARIEALLLEHHYVARGPGGTQTAVRTIDLVFDAMRTPNNLEIIRGVIEATSEQGVEVVVGTAPHDPVGATWARSVAAARREGLILVTSKLSMQQRRQFAKVGVPLVTIDPVNTPDLDLPSIGATNFAGGMDATRHLLELGHTRVAMIEGPPDAVVSIARLHGYYAALSEAGLKPEPALIEPADFTFESGFAAAARLLDQKKRPTAIFASNDLQALGAMEAARVRGVQVPVDLSVVGFDDMTASKWSAPPLTTVRQPFAEMGRAAIQALFTLIAGRTLHMPRIELATELIVRQSTARPRS